MVVQLAKPILQLPKFNPKTNLKDLLHNMNYNNKRKTVLPLQPQKKRKKDPDSQETLKSCSKTKMKQMPMQMLILKNYRKNCKILLLFMKQSPSRKI